MKKANPRSYNYRFGYLAGFRRAEAMVRGLLEVQMPKEKYEILISMPLRLSAAEKKKLRARKRKVRVKKQRSRARGRT